MKTTYHENWKPIQRELGITADGYAGPSTIANLAKRLGCGGTWKEIQQKAGTTPDGIPGGNTIKAVMAALRIEASAPAESSGFAAPVLSQTEIRSGVSRYGRAGDESYLVTVPVPSNYPLTYEGKPVSKIRIHKLVADRLEAALKNIADCYEQKFGNTANALKHAPGVYIYGGSYNNRSTTGGGAKSIHAWGLALDFDPAENWYARTTAKGARLARSEYKEFFDILEHYGFYSLGRRSDLDWMHVQAAAWS